MSNYVKTVWETGDKIYAEQMNHLEGGIMQVKVYTLDYDNDGNFYTDATQTEILADIASNMIPVFVFDDTDSSSKDVCYLVSISAETETGAITLMKLTLSGIETVSLVRQEDGTYKEISIPI